MTPFLCSTILFSLFWTQENAAHAGDFLTPSEKSQIEREDNVENRIRIYESASARIHRTIRALIERQEFPELLPQMRAWQDLTAEAFRDIDRNIGRKKKSKNLIRFEIQLRKALLDLRNLKFQIPHEYQDEFESVLDRVDGVHKKLVDILFQS